MDNCACVYSSFPLTSLALILLSVSDNSYIIELPVGVILLFLVSTGSHTCLPVK